MNKQRLQLQSYLDSQIQQIEQGPSNELPTFDKLQQKLNSIEKKLVNLKTHNLKSNRIHEDQIHFEKKIIEKNDSHQFISNRSGKKIQQKALELQKTPQKQLKIISKTMSEGYFQFNPISSKKQRQKKYDSQAKTNYKYLSSNNKSKKTIKTTKKIQQIANQNKISSKKSLGFQRSKLNKTHEQHLINLKKDIENCMKSNAQLKVKISNLQAYKTQYSRLKQIFLQCEKTRKKIRG